MILNTANNAASTLASGITDSATSLSVQSGDGALFPDPPFVVSIGDEIILVEAKSGETFSSLTRGYEGTTAASHSAGDDVENRWTAGQVEALATTPVYSVPVEPDGTTDNTSAIQAVLDEVEASGGGTVYLATGTYIVSSALEIGDNTTVSGDGPSSIVKKQDDSGEFPVFTNKDRVGGNTGIHMRDLAVDGNRENPSTSTDRYSAIHFEELSGGSFQNLHVRGGRRPLNDGSQGYPGAGEGLEFVRCENISVRGGRYYENDYDGVKFRNCQHGALVGAIGDENGRALVQMTGESGDVEATGSEYITVAGNAHRQSSSSPPNSNNSGIALHSALHCTITGNTIYGPHDHGIDLLQGSNQNVITDNFIAFRGGATGINLWEFGGTNNDRNTIRGNTLMPLGGSDGTWISVEGDENIIESNYLLTGDGTGTWSVVNDGANNVYRFNDAQPSSWTFTDNGAGTTRIENSDVGSGGGEASPTFDTLTDGATVSWDVSSAEVAKVTLGGNRTLEITGAEAGGVYTLIVVQDSTGSRTLTWPSEVVWEGDVAPTLTTDAEQADVMRFTYDGTSFFGEVVGQDFTEVEESSEGIYETDFSEYTTDSPPDDWTQRWVTSGIAWTVRDEAGATGGKVLEIEVTTIEGKRRALSWDAIDSDPDREDIELLWKFRVSNNKKYILGLARASGSEGTETGYVIGRRDSDGSIVDRTGVYDGGSFTEIDAVPATLVADTWYWERMRLNGTSVQFRAWEDGQTEPSSWTNDDADATLSAAGWVGLMTTMNTGIVEVDVFKAGTGGNSPTVE